MQRRAIKQKEVRQTTTSERRFIQPLLCAYLYHSTSIQQSVPCTGPCKQGVHNYRHEYYHEVLTCHYVRSYSTAAV